MPLLHCFPERDQGIHAVNTSGLKHQQLPKNKQNYSLFYFTKAIFGKKICVLGLRQRNKNMKLTGIQFGKDIGCDFIGLCMYHNEKYYVQAEA